MKWKSDNEAGLWKADTGHQIARAYVGERERYTAWGPTEEPDEALTPYNSYKFQNPYEKRSGKPFLGMLGVSDTLEEAHALCVADAGESDAA